MKPFDLEQRTFMFARDCRYFVKKLKIVLLLRDDCEQLLRSSGSVASNYIEANESLSKKDFLMRIKICRKEAKESRLWLILIEVDSDDLNEEKNRLIQEATELMKIFNSIIQKSS